MQEELELAFFQGELKALEFFVAGPRVCGAVSPAKFAHRRCSSTPSAARAGRNVAVCTSRGQRRRRFVERDGRGANRQIIVAGVGSRLRQLGADRFRRAAFDSQSQWVGIWSRQGIVIATKSSAVHLAEQNQELCQELSARGDGDRRFEPSPTAMLKKLLVEGDELVRRVIHIKHQLTLPENQPGAAVL